MNLQKQSKNVDFGAALATRPLATGSVLPATCAVGNMYFNSSAPAGQNVFGCVATNTWTLEGGSSGGGTTSGGATTASQLADFQAVRTNANTLQIGPLCSAATPCNARYGATTYSFTSPASVTISSGTGTLYIYISNAGTLTAGSNLGTACTAVCTAASGVTAFPSDSVPLFSWTATNGSFDSSGGMDFRAFLSGTSVQAGTGLAGTISGNSVMLSVDPTFVMLQTSVPSSASAACSQGQWATDGTYFYLCVASSAWKRTGLSAW